MQRQKKASNEDEGRADFKIRPLTADSEPGSQERTFIGRFLLLPLTEVTIFVTSYIFDKMYWALFGPWGSLSKSCIKRGPQPSTTAPEL